MVILALHSAESGKPTSRVVEVGGGRQRELASVPGLADGVRVSPDQASVAFVDPSGALYVVPRIGGPPQEVARSASGWPMWSPNSSLIWAEHSGRTLMVRERSGARIATIATRDGSAGAVVGWDAQRRRPVVFVPGKSGVAGSLLEPDGKGGMTRVADGVRFAGSSSRGMLLLEPRSQSATRAAEPDPYRLSVTWSLVAVGSGKRAGVRTGLPSEHVALSHDGTRIAYSRMDKEAGVQLFVSKADGTAEKRVTSLPSSGGYVPVWSSDDRFIVFSAIQTQGSAPGKHLYQVDPASGKVRPLLAGPDKASTLGSVFAVR